MNQSLPPYSCLDATLHRNEVTIEYWRDSELQLAALVNAVFVLVFFLVGLPSNLLIITSIVRQKLYQEPTHILLLNLAISDLLLCVLVMPFTITAGFAGEFIFGGSDYTRCRVYQMSVILVALTLFSIHILSVLSVDRFLFIKTPLQYANYVTVRRTLVAVVLVWALAVILSMPPLFGFGDIDYTISIATCTPRFQHRTSITKNIYYMVMLILESLIPLGVLFVTNTWVVCIAKRHLSAINKINHISKVWKLYTEKLKSAKKQLRVACVFGTILIANTVTWIPLIVRSLLLDSRLLCVCLPLLDITCLPTPFDRGQPHP